MEEVRAHISRTVEQSESPDIRKYAEKCPFHYVYRKHYFQYLRDDMWKCKICGMQVYVDPITDKLMLYEEYGVDGDGNCFTYRVVDIDGVNMNLFEGWEQEIITDIWKGLAREIMLDEMLPKLERAYQARKVLWAW